MPTPPIMRDRNCLAPVAARPGTGTVTRRRLKACWGRCAWKGLLSLRCVPARLLPARPGSAAGIVFPQPGALRMTGSTAALVSFEESSALLHELAGVDVSVSQVQRAAEALGAEIAADNTQNA